VPGLISRPARIHEGGVFRAALLQGAAPSTGGTTHYSVGYTSRTQLAIGHWTTERTGEPRRTSQEERQSPPGGRLTAVLTLGLTSLS
jgi:hypothetical protein